MGLIILLPTLIRCSVTYTKWMLIPDAVNLLYPFWDRNLPLFFLLSVKRMGTSSYNLFLLYLLSQ